MSVTLKVSMTDEGFRASVNVRGQRAWALISGPDDDENLRDAVAWCVAKALCLYGSGPDRLAPKEADGDL
jgi:hypothetical protein